MSVRFVLTKKKFDLKALKRKESLKSMILWPTTSQNHLNL